MEAKMGKINDLFRKRIGFELGKNLDFEDLPDLLSMTAKTIPFENFCIIKGESLPVTEENLVAKTLEKKEGGVCYELNPILYLFLLENGFEVSLVRGVVYQPQSQTWSSTGRTHTAIILNKDGRSYLIDTGFGSNLPLVPVPLSGETVKSESGEYRIIKTENSLGDCLLEMKRRGKDEDWVIGYVFDSANSFTDIQELEEMQKIIVESDQSPFNKNPLITRLTDNGSITLTRTSFTEWSNGEMKKKEIDEKKFGELAEKYFGVKY